MEKLTFTQLCDRFEEHNRQNGVTRQFDDDGRLWGVVVFAQGPWFRREYSETERSYRFSSDNKRFLPDMGGSSVFADCLDGIEDCLRLDGYLDAWGIDYCYIER